MARPSLSGGDSKLGYSNLYGRLLNEGPYGMLDLRLDILAPKPGTTDTWTSVQARIEGGSVGNASPAIGRLDNFRLSQLVATAGNVLLDHVTWRLGTLDMYLGELGLYDTRPAQIFFETLGLSGQYQLGMLEILLGVGDSGYFLKRERYHTVLTGGGYVRLRPIEQLEFALGGQYMFEPEGRGNRFAPHRTPGVRYEDYVRKEVLSEFLADNPGQIMNFPRPEPTSATSWKAIGYLGFGRLGPLVWNNVFGTLEQRHPDTYYTEESGGESRDIYLAGLTDERYQVTLGDEAQIRIIPDKLDAVWSGLMLYSWDADDKVRASEANRTVYSTVLRLQYYLTHTFHLLGETSYAHEISRNGNLYRSSSSSVFANANGIADSRGLEYGDESTRNTWQGKAGVVINPGGRGIFTRPSLRILYGTQYSSQTNAFGNSYPETLESFSYFGSPNLHWHHLVALEAEAWF
jgi:hypothetical protein